MTAADQLVVEHRARLIRAVDLVALSRNIRNGSVLRRFMWACREQRRAKEKLHG